MLSIEVGRMLEEYARKRIFSRTPEPAPSPGDVGRSAAGPRPVFCVQRHDASRLHYDFRLEVDGALKSWAVPKGPSLDPGVRHLAVHVEDHPLEYGSFEGNIPSGDYGGGSVMLWDRGTYELLDAGISANDQLARGDFKFRLSGEKLHGDFAIVRMKNARMKNRGKGDEWLLIKKRDQFAAPGWNIEDYAASVLTGRSQEEIAQNLPAHPAKRSAAPAKPRRKLAASSGAKESRAKKSVAKKKENQKSGAGKKSVAKKKSFDPSTLQGARAAPLPEWFEPMSATLAAQPPAGDDWLFEVKWDGVRALCFLDGVADEDQFRIFSRSGRRCERQYPELSVLPHFVAARQAILDGEIAVLDDEGVSRFELIQPRIANTDAAAVAHLARSTPVVLFLFDLLYLDGYDLRNVALGDRRRALEAVLAPSSVIHLSATFPGSGEELLAAARENGLEGILAKHASSRYESRRSREWLKIKLVNQQEFLICGFTAGERDPIGALVLGFHEDGQLVWAGNVGTGFTAPTLRDLRARLEPLIAKRSPFASNSKPPSGVTSSGLTWVRPELVAMIKFSNWTAGKHLRAPVYLGLRDDVQAHAVHRESLASLLSGTANEAALTLDGHHLKLTNLNKVLFPADGYTKRDLLNYYDAVAPLILPHLKDRPLSLKRYPNGIDAQYFFQKDVPANQGTWLRKVKIWSEHSESKRAGPIHYVFADDRASLLYLTNLGCIDQNPWMSRVDSIDSPDFVLIDLDPYQCGYDKIVEAALLVRNVLDSLGLTGYPKTTGGDGIHIYIPLEPVYSYEDSRNFAELLARLVVAERPGLFTTPRSVAQRQPDRVYFDAQQNAKSKTIAAPYSARAYPHAPVSTPLEWSEVKKGLRPAQFTIRNAPQRFARTGDLFEGVLKKTQTIELALQRLEKLLPARK
ncbi:MAG: DNA ligase D [Candidatus Korobacteraceae bacterium]